ncbi:MAG: DUF481 domain-containing protein [Bacteroidota bacterium]
MKRLSIVLFIQIISITALNAQILKIRKGDITADSSGYFIGSIGFNFSLNNRSSTPEETTEFRSIEASSDLIYVSEKHAYYVLSSFENFTATGAASINTGYGHLRANFFRKKRLSLESFTQLQYDRSRNMQLRFLIGSGVKYRLYEKKQSKFYIGSGLMYEREEWQPFEEGSGLRIRDLPKFNNYIRTHYDFNDHTSIDLLTYHQFGYDYISDVWRNRISVDISLEFKLTNRLSFVASGNMQYEDRPLININNFIYSVRNGILISF